MPLTPADVHNVAFSKPPIGKRGYNEDEVDAFLDLVENELTRLVENADLRQRVTEMDQELADRTGRRRSAAHPGHPAVSARARTRAGSSSLCTRRRSRRPPRPARTSTSRPPAC